MKHPSETALKIVRKYVLVHEINAPEDGKSWAVFVGNDKGVCEFFHDEHQANKAALHVIYPLAHAIDTLISKVMENQNV